MYLPEIFPTSVRCATGTGISYNSGRFLTAAGVMAAGLLIQGKTLRSDRREKPQG